MDNMGDAKGASGETGGLFGAVEMNPGVADGANLDSLNGALEGAEQQSGGLAELAGNDNSAETTGEAQPTSSQSAVAVAIDDSTDDDKKKDEDAKKQLEQIKVPRNANSLPAAYEKAVRDILARNRKDPFRLVKEIDMARWDLMEKAYSRKLGDGFNGAEGK